MARPMSKNLYDWCIENDREDILQLWDYELNDCTPKDVAYRTHNKYYFKCLKGLHKSELKCIDRLVSGNTKLSCNQCNFYSFKQWCIDNIHADWLLLWDYELNQCSPDEVAYSSNKKYWFKCPRGLHESELKRLNDISKKDKRLSCNKCNSFGQWLIDIYGEDAIERYWDYEKNKINPFEISRSSSKKVWLFCQEKSYHGSYEVVCGDFIGGNRCPYCSRKGTKIHPKDSFRQKLINDYGKDAIERYWSKKNTLDPFGIAPYSTIKVWIKCQKDETHKDYEVTCNNFNHGSRCPECNESHGEREIRRYLNTYNIDFIPQKEFSDLVGVKKGNLSYDFYLLEYNLLIEYQGQYHDGTVPNQSEEDYLKQQEHDRRKREYAEQNGIRLLEIWYWDFDNIEAILNKNIK